MKVSDWIIIWLDESESSDDKSQKKLAIENLEILKPKMKRRVTKRKMDQI